MTLVVAGMITSLGSTGSGEGDMTGDGVADCEGVGDGMVVGRLHARMVSNVKTAIDFVNSARDICMGILIWLLKLADCFYFYELFCMVSH
jgi:hypothetical protein